MSLCRGTAQELEKVLCSLDEMRDGKEPMFEYVHTAKDSSRSSAALEPHHTHFILIDNGKSGASAWGGEIEFGLQMQLAYCSHDTKRGAARRRRCRAARARRPGRSAPATALTPL